MPKKLRAVSLQEILDSPEIAARQAALERQVRLDGAYIVLNGAYPYEVPLADLRTDGHILRWVKHLCEKNWVTRDMIGRFVALARQAQGESGNVR